MRSFRRRPHLRKRSRCTRLGRRHSMTCRSPTSSVMSLVMVNRLNGVLVIAAVLGVGGSVTGQDPSPADRAALANAKILGIEATVLDIVGVSLGVSGVLKDLGAKVTPEEIRIELSADVLFDFDKSDLKPDATGSLAKVADVINAYPAAPPLIEGHTDAKGTHPYNVTL